MVTRLRGILLGVEGAAGEIEPEGQTGVCYEILLPAYVAESMASRVGERVELHTRQHLEAQGNGTSFVPRLLAFPSAQERSFFEVFTSVKGLGPRRALRAMAAPPHEIAAAVVAKDAKSLTKLPEVGKKLAETMIVDLSGKVDRFLIGPDLEPGSGLVGAEVKPTATTGLGRAVEPTGPMAEAVEALVSLGQTRGEAERMVERASAKVGGPFESVDAALAAIFGG